MPSPPVLDVRNLQVRFFSDAGANTAVDHINFQLHAGRTLGIVGESGSGKSVTSLALLGLVPTPGKITQGEILWQDSDNYSVDLRHLTSSKLRQYRGGQLAMIFQEPMSALNPVYTIGFQVTEAIRLHRNVTVAEARRQAISRFQEVKLLPADADLWAELSAADPTANEARLTRRLNERKQNYLKRYPHQLSGGQLQRVVIAMAIACDPTVLIADEPTTALDVTVQATILTLLRNLCQERQMAMVFISHDLAVIAQVADEVAVMYQGKVVEYGSVNQILTGPSHPYTKGLIACRPPLDRRWQKLPTVDDYLEVTQNPDGLTVLRERPDAPKLDALPTISSTQLADRLDSLQQKSPLLTVETLRIGYSQGPFWQSRYFYAVDDVSFVAYPGETLGLVGESGCGKSTLARAILRLQPIHSGRIIFDNQEISQWRPREPKLRSLRRDLQIIFQNPYNSLNPRLPVGQAIIEPLRIHGIGDRKSRQERVAYLLDRVGLDESAQKRYPHEFSGGQRQRICIARALATNPRFIICDESVSALDVSVQAQVLNLLQELQQELGLTYIFISHDLSVVKFMSDRILVMNRGRIEEIGPAEQIYQQPQTDYARSLIDAIPTGCTTAH